MDAALGEPLLSTRCFYLSDSDQAIIAKRHGNHNRLGFTLQSTKRRFLGLFLGDLLAVPMSAIQYVVVGQLSIMDLSGLPRYAERAPTQREHTLEIRQRFGYRDFNDPRGRFALMRFLYAHERLSAERTGELFDLAITWLIDQKLSYLAWAKLCENRREA
jgi:TnpA family transposase